METEVKTLRRELDALKQKYEANDSEWKRKYSALESECNRLKAVAKPKAPTAASIFKNAARVRHGGHV